MEREIGSAGDRPFMLVPIYSCTALRQKLHDKASSWDLGYKIRCYYFWSQPGTIVELFLLKWFSDIYDNYMLCVLNPLCLTFLCSRCKLGILQQKQNQSKTIWVRGKPSQCCISELLYWQHIKTVLLWPKVRGRIQNHCTLCRNIDFTQPFLISPSG